MVCESEMKDSCIPRAICSAAYGCKVPAVTGFEFFDSSRGGGVAFRK